MKMGLLPPPTVRNRNCIRAIANADSAQDAKSSQNLNIESGFTHAGNSLGSWIRTECTHRPRGETSWSAKACNMTYHGGKIMPTAVSQTIFWGTSWGTYLQRR